MFHVKRPYSSKDRLIEYAVNSLRFFKKHEIREFALEKLRSHVSRPDIYTNLFIGNYKDGDSDLLTEIVYKAKNQHQIHDLVYSYVEIFQANKTKDCEKPLVALYKKLTCGLHREDIVRIMIENNVLPGWILEEIKYDSLDSTRELIKENDK
jgi:ferredoxin-fold anticodon binding domain-containing protein